MTKILRTVLAAGVLLCGAPRGQAQDVAGSKDHPLISRYPGSRITDYMQKEYDEITLPLGKLVATEKLQKSQHLEGKVTRIRYAGPAGRSTLEILRNYQEALRKAGFATLYTCGGQECGEGDVTLFASFKDTLFAGWQSRLVSARFSRPEGDAYVCLIMDDNFNFGAANRPEAILYIVEMKPMETGLVTVDAASLASDISRTGHASVYGIYFDTGKADVKPESDATLKEIAKLLQQDSKLKLYVVGHTDNQGTLEMNMDLSMRRANAVMQALASKYGVAAARLKPLGDGPSAPIASNDSEEGRAKNRRVELVKQ